MNERIEELIRDNGGEEGTTYLENPSYESAIVGLTVDSRLVYDYEKMVEYLKKTDGMSHLEAIEFIDYNTVRALPYCLKPPIIFYPLI